MKLQLLESRNRPSSESGIALVLVLGMLVLLSGLLVAFLTTATTERTATQSASDGASARQIADSTINLVIGQIRDATSSTDSSGQINEKMTWASQPGAIRTYSGKISGSKPYPSGGGIYPAYRGGSEDYVYKLYSADRLKVPASKYATDKSELQLEVDVIEKWDRIDISSERQREYADLNEPILSPRFDLDDAGQTVEPRYPIIDPRAMFDRSDRNNPDPRSPVVEGFDAKVSSDEFVFTTDSRGRKSNEKVPYLPMPAKWLYVLRDGSVGAADLATATNPIVGRTAFWTDDETCKLNINTSSEGTFWDTPTGSSKQESGVLQGQSGAIDFNTARIMSFGASQPIKGEYQRYPGHPMTTCLSPVFGWLWGLPNPSLAPPTALTQQYQSNVYANNALYANFKEDIYQISPFIPSGLPTTKGARWNADPDAYGNNSWYIKKSATQRVPNPVVGTKHLYATVDELLFDSERNDGRAEPRATLNGRLTPQALERMRFFLTATSRAPELNLFGRPRVTLWPVAADYDLRTNFDDLFAFTSTIYKDPNGKLEKDKRFHLTRANAKSATEDFSGGPDNPFPQNPDMYEYLQEMTGGVAGGGPTIPGFGGTFYGKYGPDRDQILTEIFDYMRTVNLSDTGTASRGTNIFAPYTPTFYPEGVVHDYNRYARSVDWSGQVTPLILPADPKRANETKGLGRCMLISEAALVFHRNNTQPAPSKVGLQATLCLEMATAMPGLPGLRDTYWTRISQVKGGRTLKIQFTGSPAPVDVQFCDPGTGPVPNAYINVVNVSNHDVAQGRAYMPTLGFVNSMYYWPEHKAPTHPTDPDAPIFGDPRRDPDRLETGSANPSVKNFTFPIPGVNTAYKRKLTVQNYPYISNPIEIGARTSFSFTGPQLMVEIFTGEAPDDPRSTLIQTVMLDFPSVTAAMPVPPEKIGNPPVNAPVATFGARLTNAAADGGGQSSEPILNTDVVRSIEYTGSNTNNPPAPLPLSQQGDLRVAAAKTVLPFSSYQPRGGGLATPNDFNANYNSIKALVHGLSRGHGDAQGKSDTRSENNNKQSGTFAANLFQSGGGINRKPPILPLGINGVKRADGGPGDWDRGLSKHMDYAGGNKVDEGNLKFDYPQGNAAYQIPYYRGRGLEETGQSFFSPNRQFPSAVMLGSLPTGVKAGKPWQSLLFRPDREGNSWRHPGSPGMSFNGTGVDAPPDHLLLDLFHMPIVEPFAISEPFSTMGKVNMNYVIAPYGYASGEIKGGKNLPYSQLPRSYIRRDTALRGVFKSTYIMAVRTRQPESGHNENPHDVSDYFRYPINMDRTIEEFEARLNDQRNGLNNRDTTLFRSASEICEIDLVPSDDPEYQNNFASYWETTKAQTGDNMRERPYAHIFPRLTTKSNVYTVYMRCQSLRKSPKTAPGVFDPALDSIVGEYRGSATIERFIDPNDPQLEKYKEKEERVEPYYRYRIVGTKHFAPR